MKIKKLIIRNIASIEQGEIDFENDLKDSEKGLPASLFLITGDTGSGKSAILDCISMTLYGTTPRVRGVNGLRRNNYINGNGEEIAINNISQYTRLGISSRDECYSELFFTGNDNVNYTARYTLGFNNRKNLRKPEWSLTIGDTEKLEKKSEIAERIQKAVGLSFEQFSRMAMLAQGQFAEFLTGEKEVREKILEQLTATDIFSRYGEAITNIFKRARQEKELSAGIYEEFRRNILTDEMRQQLISEQDVKLVQSAYFQTETDRLRKQISHTEAAVKSEKEISNLQAEAARLKEIEGTPEFTKKKAVIKLWDETSIQRQLLSEKIKALDSIDTDRKTLQKRKADLLVLSSDLDIRRKEADIQNETLEAERKWIEESEPLKKIFAESQVTIHKIDNLEKLEKELIQKEKESRDGNDLIAKLLKIIELQEKDVKDAFDNCVRGQASITQRSNERDALKPIELHEENKRILIRMHSLEDLSKRISQMETEKAETEKVESETQSLTELHAELKEKSDSDSSICALAEKEKKEAEARYVTMHLSLDENFKELRNRLAEEQASNCPLCGQSIEGHLHEWATEGYFSSILSPLEEEKKRLEEEYKKAKTAADESTRKLNTASGSLKEKQNELKKKKSALSKSEDGIKKSIKELDIPDSEDIKTAVADEILKAKIESERISETIAKADRLQKEIDNLLKQKTALDKTQQEAESNLHKSKEELSEKRAIVKNAEERMIEVKNDTESNRKAISEALKGYAADWEDDPKETASRLKKEADEFAERSAKFAKDESDHNVVLKILNSLKETEDALTKQLEKIEPSESTECGVTLRSMRLEPLQKKWNTFLIDTSSVAKNLASNESIIRRIDIELNEYYQATGLTETTIKQLLGAAKEVNEARILIQKHRDETGKRDTLLTEAIKSLYENLKALDIEDATHLEDIEYLKNTLSGKEKEYTELTQELGVIKGRLEADSKTRQESERQRQDLERKILRFEKWEKMNKYFGGTKFRTLVQSHILRPLLNNANIYLRQITDHYTLTCSDENEQLSILVLDRYNNNEPRSVTVLSGGERFMISLALSLALSAMNRPDLNVDILFIDEGFGTLDAKSLEMVMNTLRRLPEINGQTGRRVGVISHREELTEQIPCQIQLRRCGEGRSRIVIP